MPYQSFFKSPMPRTEASANTSSLPSFVSTRSTTTDNFKTRNDNSNAKSLNAKKTTTPPIHPRPVIIPQSAVRPFKSTPPSTNTAATGFQPDPYIPSEQSLSYPTPHPQITIDPIHTAHIPSLSRITSLLLPIKYSNSFYSACITDPIIASVSRVAVYHETRTPTENQATESAQHGPTSEAPKNRDSSVQGKVIGGIRCRLEPLPPRALPATTTATDYKNKDEDNNQEPETPRQRPPPTTNLYIQTLHLLSAYRGNGVAASLLDSLLYEPCTHASKTTTTSNTTKTTGDGSTKRRQVSKLVKHYHIRTVTAHVHETNDDALRWYVARGFRIEEGTVENYYRRLKPTGARIVRLDLEWDDNDDNDNDDHDDEVKGGHCSLRTKKFKGNTSLDDKDKGKDDDFADWVKIDNQHHDQSQAESFHHVDRSPADSPASELFSSSSSSSAVSSDNGEDNKNGTSRKKKRKAQ